MTRLRGAVFGCGMISEFHLAGWRRIPEVEIVALGDLMPERAHQRRAQFAPAAHVYQDLPALLDHEAPDFIDILTYPASHKEHCLLAREAGVHIICQKPLCENLADVRELVAAMSGYPRLFAVHENHRYRPWFQETVRHFKEGFFGRPRLLRLEHHNDGEPGEVYKLEAERGIVLEYGTHLVDMMRALLGEPERVYARLHWLNPRVKGESVAHLVYEYPQTTAVIDIAWKPAGPLQGGMLLEGDEGEAYFEGSMTRGEAARFRLLNGGRVALDEARSPREDYVDSFYFFERECVDAILGGKPITQTGPENLKTLECTFAAYVAAERGTVVKIAAS